MPPPGTPESGPVWSAEGRFCVQPHVAGAGRGASPKGGFRGAGSSHRRNRIDHNGPGNEGAKRGAIPKVSFRVLSGRSTSAHYVVMVMRDRTEYGQNATFHRFQGTSRMPQWTKPLAR